MQCNPRRYTFFNSYFFFWQITRSSVMLFLFNDLRVNNVYKLSTLFPNVLWIMCSVNFVQLMVNTISLLIVKFVTPSPILRSSINILLQARSKEYIAALFESVHANCLESIWRMKWLGAFYVEVLEWKRTKCSSNFPTDLALFYGLLKMFQKKIRHFQNKFCSAIRNISRLMDM